MMHTYSLPKKKRIRARTALNNTLVFSLFAFFLVISPTAIRAQPGCVVPVTVANETALNNALSCYNTVSTPGTYLINLIATINLTSSTTTINNETSDVELIINGNGFSVDGQGGVDVRPFTISDSTVTFQDIIITGGNTTDPFSVGHGGGIRSVGGSITLIDSVVSGNTSTGGAGIYAGSPSFIIVNSTISANTVANGAGGGIYAAIGSLTVTDSTIANNEVTDGVGGGIYVLGADTIVTNSTISGNSAMNSIGGGGIYTASSGSSVVLYHTTITNNSAPIGMAGGIRGNSSQITLAHSIIADQASGDDCDGNFFTSNGYNLASDDTCGVNFFGDVELSALAYNGGNTQTHAIPISSSARDAIPPQYCDLAADQRGISRPQGTNCDIGAYELELAQITISKSAEGGEGEYFSFSGPPGPYWWQDGTFNLGYAGSRVIPVIPGTYTFTENALAGWQLSDIQCTDSGTFAVNLATRTVTVTLQAGDSTSCTFINERVLGSITVTKSVLDAPAGFDGTFTICLSGDDYLDCRVIGSGGGTFTWSNLPAGTYELNENDPGDNWDVRGNNQVIEIEGGEEYTATITNTYIPDSATITVQKDVDWQNETPDNNVQFEICVTNDYCQIFSASDGWIHDFTVEPGTYTVYEINAIGWTTTIAPNDGEVTVGPGEQVQVWVSNTIIPPPDPGTITVTKQVEGDEGAPQGPFTICLMGTSAGASYPGGNCVDLNNGQSWQWTVIADQTYSITENDPGPDFSVSGETSVTVADNQPVNITITNTYTAPEPECTSDPSVLSGTIDVGPTQASGYITNNATVPFCGQVGIASYMKYDEDINNQILFDGYDTDVYIEPGQTIELTVAVPECQAQVDLFWGGLILDMSTGERYGRRLLAAVHSRWMPYCVPATEEPL